ncbi:MAG: hypothetical protein JXB32_17835 [Deltaproteobacteria bacterium]|nr:hypothetical protein [Deltaproteobacteria bacterium]
MGLFDLFRKKDKPAAAAAAGGPAPSRGLEKNVKKLLNKYLQPEERWGAVQAVLADHSETATAALLQRFTIYVEPSAVDNEEKEYIADALASRGEAILPQVKEALRAQESISWLVRIASRILPRDGLRDLLIELLGELDTEYERNPERKIQLIMALADFPDDAAATAVARFLEDVNETARFQAVSTVFGCRSEATREPLIKLFLEDESMRIKNAVLDGFVETGWPVTGHRGDVEKALPKGYVLDRAGVIRHRPKA